MILSLYSSVHPEIYYVEYICIVLLLYLSTVDLKFSKSLQTWTQRNDELMKQTICSEVWSLPL